MTNEKSFITLHSNQNKSIFMTNTFVALNEVQNNERLMNLTLDLVNQHGLAWSVQKEKLFTQDGRETKSYGIFRSDNGAWLSSMSEHYHTLDNFELAKLLIFAGQSIEELNIEESNGGLFREGRKVFIQIPLPNVEIGNAKVTRNLTAINSHDGSSGVALGTTQTVIACQNTFYRAYRSEGMTRIGHHSTLQSRLEETILNLESTIQHDQVTIERFRKMLDITPDIKDIKAIKDILFNVTDENIPSTRKTNLMAKFDQCVEIEFAKEGKNLWGLFNGVTRYTNHEMKKNYANNDKLENVMIGSGARMNTTAYNRLLHYVAN